MVAKIREMSNDDMQRGPKAERKEIQAANKRGLDKSIKPLPRMAQKGRKAAQKRTSKR